MKKVIPVSIRWTLRVSVLQRKLSSALDYLKNNEGGSILITRRGKRSAVLISYKEFCRLKGIEERCSEEEWLLDRAERAEKEWDGSFLTMEEMRADLGLDGGSE